MRLLATRLTAIASAVKRLFSPASLFRNSEQGVWYDPSDFSTLFQDSAGTTPVTAVEQPVGLMLDKSQGLVLGPELVTNGDFSNGSTGWVLDPGWTVSGGVASVNTPGAPRYLRQLGKLTVGKTYLVTYTTAVTSGGNFGAGFGWSPQIANTTSGTYTARLTAATTDILFYANSDSIASIDNISIKELAGNHAFQATSASRPVLSARYNLLTATETLSTQSVTTAATTHTLRFTGAGSVTLTGTAIGVYTAGTYSVTTTAGSLTLTVLGTVTQADLRAANNGITQPDYQRVNSSTDYATAGFLPYLKFDGVDDSLSTNSISFTSTDKMSVFAGVRKLSDAAIGAIVGFSSSPTGNNGAFEILGPAGAGATDYRWTIRGTATATMAPTGFPAPITNVLTGIADIGADIGILRINGAQATSSAADQGTGNFGNYPLYISRRAGTSLPFNGHLYSLIVRGAQSTDSQIVNAENYVNSKTGAF